MKILFYERNIRTLPAHPRTKFFFLNYNAWWPMEFQYNPIPLKKLHIIVAHYLPQCWCTDFLLQWYHTRLLCTHSAFLLRLLPLGTVALLNLSKKDKSKYWEVKEFHWWLGSVGCENIAIFSFPRLLQLLLSCCTVLPPTMIEFLKMFFPEKR